ncbi:MAG: response regulator [Candidatus Methanoperedens sp.]|nr:response regulator [Candidatus Methanoperedens sp.]
MTKLLVVEDDFMDSRLICDILKAQGLTFHYAKDGIEAIDMARKMLYDLILMDIKLPRMDGIETTRIIKNMTNYKKVPVIALTAYALEGDKERFLAAGLDDYISKPFDISDMIKKLEKYCSHDQ